MTVKELVLKPEEIEGLLDNNPKVNKKLSEFIYGLIKNFQDLILSNSESETFEDYNVPEVDEESIRQFTVNTMSVNLRLLYEFFDSYKVFINAVPIFFVSPETSVPGEDEPDKHTIVSPEKPVVWKTNINNEDIDMASKFETRAQAERFGFLKAFPLLEERL